MIHTEIRCDGCDRAEVCQTGKAAAHEMRHWLRRRGWRCGLPGGRDLCPRCYSKGIVSGYQKRRRTMTPDAGKGTP